MAAHWRGVRLLVSSRVTCSWRDTRGRESQEEKKKQKNKFTFIHSQLQYVDHCICDNYNLHLAINFTLSVLHQSAKNLF